eukprot:g26091.t1
MSNDSYNTVSTRTVPVRAFTQKNMNPFEGDNICLNVLNWRSIMWIDVMYQSTPGAHARRVAGAVWDPWTGSLLQKCFWNVKICEPHIGTDRAFPGQQVKLWEFEDLIDADGMPKNGHYVEQRVNLMPNGGLLSLQMTHLGPRQVLEERDDPSDQPSVELGPPSDQAVEGRRSLAFEGSLRTASVSHILITSSPLLSLVSHGPFFGAKRAEPTISA